MDKITEQQPYNLDKKRSGSTAKKVVGKGLVGKGVDKRAGVVEK